MFERLAAMLTGLTKTIDSVTVQEYADCSKVPTAEMLFDLMGMGKDPSELSADNPMFRAVSIQYEQAIHATAELLDVDGSFTAAGAAAGPSSPTSVIRCGGNWNSSGAFALASGTVELDGAGAATVSGAGLTLPALRIAAGL